MSDLILAAEKLVAVAKQAQRGLALGPMSIGQKLTLATAIEQAVQFAERQIDEERQRLMKEAQRRDCIRELVRQVRSS